MKQPSLISGRENDNASLAGWDSDGTLTIRPEPRLKARNIWYRFRLENLAPGESLVLDFVDVYQPSGHIPLFLSWDNGDTWARSEDAKPPYRIPVKAATLEVSRNLPYSYGRLAEFVRWFDSRVAGAPGRSELLCQSDRGRDVPVFVFDPHVGNAPLVWVQARAHAFESHSSHVAEQLVRWIASGKGDALRRRAMVCVVPIIDVDAVAEGSAGKDREPHDPNRDYLQERYPQVRAIKRRLTALAAVNPLRVFLDLHDPWYHNESQWYIRQEEEAAFEPFRAAFQAALAGSPNSWKDNYVNDAQHNVVREPSLLSAHRWVRQTWPESITTAVEIPHNVDADGRSITHGGLAGYAAAIGNALTATCG